MISGAVRGATHRGRPIARFLRGMLSYALAVLHPEKRARRSLVSAGLLNAALGLHLGRRR
jgi:hypothetical protein